MQRYPSRSERRQVNLYSLAEKGFFVMENTVLYPSECRKLKKQGFVLKNVRDFDCDYTCHNKKFVIADIIWKDAFGSTIPNMVYSYVTLVINTFPRNSVDTFAKELYVIASRANNENK